MKNETVNLALGKDFVQAIIASNTRSEEIAEAIMASGADLSIVLKGCFGFKHKQEFHTGRNVYCSQKVWDYSTQESKDKDDTVSREMGECKIIGFNHYTNYYEVEHDYYNKSSQSTRKVTVDACTLSSMV